MSRELPTCGDCKWWVPIEDTPESWGNCVYMFPPLPFWTHIPDFGSISPAHFGCPVCEALEDER